MALSKFTSNSVLYISSFPPRECGLATFTQDLTTAIDKQFNPAVKSKVVAINDQPTSIYNYGNKVVGNITATELENYVSLAREINARDEIKIVNIQHEFGIFGGDWGDFLVPFLQVIEKPVVTTFHSIIPNPNDYLKYMVDFIAKQSKAVVIMNELSRNILENEYNVPKSKIFTIPHGIPQVSFESSSRFKKELGLDGKNILSTFGLISPGKGIEYAIRALPKIVKKHPNTIYLVIGETHPIVRKEDGERYRNFLNGLVKSLNLGDNVKFYNRYLPPEEVIYYLQATDVYIFSANDPFQSVSGTLSYAMGCGRPVVSTPSAYAKYMINHGQNGFLAKFKDPNSIARLVNEVLADDKLAKSMSTDSYEKTRPMTWPNVAGAYFKLYRKLAEIETEEKKMPEVKLDHLIRLTDDFGVLHFAKYGRPEKRYGYNLDDNARALIVCARSYESNKNPEILDSIRTYLKFIKYVQRGSGTFSNIVSYRKQRDGTSDEDVQGRAILALGYAASRSYLPEDITDGADSIFHKSVRRISAIKAPRSTAFAMLGLYYHLKDFSHPNKLLKKTFVGLADRLVAIYQINKSDDWQWFENQLTYSNSKLPEALLFAYQMTKKKKYLDIAKESLDFLSWITFEKKHYIPIGQNGWYFRHKKRSYFDQQPEDAASMVETKVVAYQVTGDKKHLNDAYTAFRWFLGKNHLGQMVYDENTGGCYDGVGQYAINLNQGAESTISYLLARLALENHNLLL